MNTKKITAGITVVLTALVLACTVSLIMALPVKWLWNWVIVDIFYMEKISVLQAWGLSALTSLLFKTYSAKSKD